MTKARKAILEALKASVQPVTAMMLAKEPSLSYDQATVYRNLHYLDELGMAQSFILHCTEHGTERYYSYRRSDCGIHHHWFHCEKCHRFIDLGSCGYDEQMHAWEKKWDFTITDHTFFLTGICSACKA